MMKDQEDVSHVPITVLVPVQEMQILNFVVVVSKVSLILKVISIILVLIHVFIVKITVLFVNPTILVLLVQLYFM